MHDVPNAHPALTPSGTRPGQDIALQNRNSSADLGSIRTRINPACGRPMNFTQQDIEDLEDALFYASIYLTQNWLRKVIGAD